MSQETRIASVAIAAIALLSGAGAKAQEGAADAFINIFNVGGVVESTGGGGNGGFQGDDGSVGCGGDIAGGSDGLRQLLEGIGFSDPTTADLFQFCDNMTGNTAVGWTGAVGRDGDAVLRQQAGLAPDELFMQMDQAATLTGVQVGNIASRIQQIKLTRRGLGDLGGYAFERGRDAPRPFEGAFGLREPTAGNEAAIFAKALQRGFNAGDGLFGIQGLSGFLNGQYTFIDADDSSSEIGSEGHGGGFTIGMDKQLGENAFLGLAFGYSRLDTDFDSSFGESDLDDFTFSAYGSVFFLEDFYVDGVLSGSILRFDQERDIPSSAPGVSFNSLDSEPDAWNITGDLGVGGEFRLDPVDLNPYVRVAISHTDVESFTESGSTLALKVNSQDNTSVTSTLGLSASLPVSVEFGVVSPYLRGEYIHEYNDQADDLRGNLALIPTAGFKLEPNDTDRDYATVGAGVAATFGKGISAFADYDVVLGFSNLVVHQATLGGRLEF